MRAFRRLAAPLAAPLVALVLLAGLAPASLAVDPAPLRVEGALTNLGLVHAMAADVAAAVLTDFAGQIGERFQAQAESEHSGNGILALALEQAARERGLAVVEPALDVPVRLDYRILELRVAYTGVDRSAFWTSRDVERHGGCVLAARLVDTASGATLATTQREVVMADRFDYALLDLVRSESYGFTQPELSERDWSKSAEPFVVTGMIAGLIYLFFSNQSSE